ncbi:MAG: DUF547 domain-containing protein [Lewinella sp.]
MEPQPTNHLSEQLLLTVKKQQDTAALQKEMANIPLPVLKTELMDDDRKKAFWLNVYNAYYQILRIKKNMDKPDIYRKRAFTIAGEPFSLDDVEHGILRKFRYKYSLGYLANPFTSRLIKGLAVEELDYRIHFALNCGAKSCPPIAFYKVKNINSQLDLATQAFLEGETKYNDDKKVVHTTALFQWFAGDFGGKKGIRKIYQQQLGKDISAYSIKYKEYSWEDDLGNFVA